MGSWRRAIAWRWPAGYILVTWLASCSCPPCPTPPPVVVEVPALLPPGRPLPAPLVPGGWEHVRASDGETLEVPGGWSLLPTRELDALAVEVYLWRAWAAAAESGGE